ncbi:MAG: hypothetical protein L6Q99_18630 [Planctomycetes bacterium]|nr:hypothetical protein [Planctomycetota bacterium]
MHALSTSLLACLVACTVACTRGETFVTRGREALREGDARAATEHFARALESLEPGSTSWLDALVGGYDAEAASRDRRAAAQTLLARLGVEPDALGARELGALAEHVLDAGDAAFAFELARMALERHPDDATLFEVRERADSRRAYDTRDQKDNVYL